ncbi:DUF3667 domain-containing protein [Chitinophaga horti]|uniref:DUF3667 domain-containing protein n=1 Tax=Chitinophaga horti TaxID=2920382 RepID=A0ABY6J7E8_9BACT|nr:DUF3667 domain-containing protein [Chitinophaga horti]UYQ94202.1 DUF3667 domain-containing protein [Chitinophaga horti]
MSANHLRKDKTCLNCGREVPERFCTHCGQENVEPHETFAHLVGHFFQDITHYDSKAWITIRDLLFKPGLLTKLYLAGKRQSFVNPIRMYVFTSFVFFLVLAYVGPHHDPYEVHAPGDDIDTQAYTSSIDSIDARARRADEQPGLNASVTLLSDTAFTHILRTTVGEPERAVRQYDSVQATIPAAEQSRGTERFFARSFLYMHGKYGSNVGRALLDKLQHNVPKMMFVFLPLFALLLQMLYRRKGLVYADHAIFTIHFHTFLFLLGIVSFLLDHWLHTEWFSSIAFLLSGIYFVIALKRVYAQSTRKSLLKAAIVFITYSLSILLIIVGYVISILAFV